MFGSPSPASHQSPVLSLLYFVSLKTSRFPFYSPTMRSFFSVTANDNKLPNSFSGSSKHQRMPPSISLIWTLSQTHWPGFGFRIFFNIKVRISQFSCHAAVSETTAELTVELSDSLPGGLCPPLMKHAEWNFPHHPDRRLFFLT